MSVIETAKPALDSYPGTMTVMLTETPKTGHQSVRWFLTQSMCEYMTSRTTDTWNSLLRNVYYYLAPQSIESVESMVLCDRP